MSYHLPPFRRPWIWAARFRHRRGYGVHSPFAYSFLRGVVYERTAYYAYHDLDRLHPWWQRWTKAYPLLCQRLLFRLANFVHPQTMLLIGSRPLERAYIEAAVPSARWADADMASDDSNHNQTTSAHHHGQAPAAPPDFIFVANEELPHLQPPPMPQHGMIVAEGIHHDAAAEEAWQRLQTCGQTAITFDLYDYGILIFDKTLAPQHYIVNF